MAGPARRSSRRRSAIFGMANVPFVYVSVNIWRTIHPKTTVVPTLVPGMRGAVLVLRRSVHVAVRAPVDAARTQLEHQRAALDALYLEEE